MKLINIVIIENENISRIGAAAILSETENIHVCSIAKYGREGIEIIDKYKPDIVVMNIDLPDINGIDAISTIKQRHKSIRIVVMTANSSRDTINAAINNGADCYYCKNSTREEVGERFIEAVMAAYNNESWIDPTINRVLIETWKSKDALEKNQFNLLNQFSIREITVLKLTAEGIRNNEIAIRMYISEGTVRSYMHSLFTKLGVRDRLNAVREGIRIGILSFTDLKIEQEATQETHYKVKPNRKGEEKKTKVSHQKEKGWVA
jgi:DNA-binding NarL/FixJ family response regulator